VENNFLKFHRVILKKFTEWHYMLVISFKNPAQICSVVDETNVTASSGPEILGNYDYGTTFRFGLSSLLKSTGYEEQLLNYDIALQTWAKAAEISLDCRRPLLSVLHPESMFEPPDFE
jgi:hypothetical protein